MESKTNIKKFDIKIICDYSKCKVRTRDVERSGFDLDEFLKKERERIYNLRWGLDNGKGL
jgi:hypothetical protein